MSMVDTSFRQGNQPPDLLWIDQLTQELLLTVQAFQRLRVALGNKFLQGKS